MDKLSLFFSRKGFYVPYSNGNESIVLFNVCPEIKKRHRIEPIEHRIGVSERLNI